MAEANAKLVIACPEGNDRPPPQKAPWLPGLNGNSRSNASLRARSNVPAAPIAVRAVKPLSRKDVLCSMQPDPKVAPPAAISVTRPASDQRPARSWNDLDWIRFAAG